MPNFLRIVFYILLILLVSSACKQQPKDTQASSIEVTDYTGAIVRLDTPATRVVTLAPHIVENLFSAGAGHTIVGIVDYSNYPQEALNIANIGSAFNINQERIVELNPDLIIAWQTGNSHSVYNKLKQLGFAVYIDEPKTLEDIAKSIRDFGVLTGYSEHANSVASSYLLSLQKLENLYKNVEPVSSFYQIWNKPLQTINGEHIISDAIQLCGGDNIYADELAVAPIINIESILERDPQAIIASGTSASRPVWLDDWKQWDSLHAVKENNLFFVQADHLQRHSVRLLKGIQSLCTQLDSVRNP